MKNTPEIRFSGFSDDWEQRKLGELGETYTGLSGKTKEDFGHGEAKFVTYMNVYSNPVANPNQVETVEIDKRQNSVKKGDVFFTTSSETPEEVGMTSVWLENTPNTYLNSFCFGYRPDEKIDSLYLAYFLRSESFRKQMILLAQGISRFNISKNKTMELLVSIPPKEEQHQIGKFFSQLDTLLTLHQRKCEVLKKFKKSMLQKMFPQNGKRVPEVRFAGFTDDWEQRKLEEVGSCQSGIGFPDAEQGGTEGIPFFKVSDMNISGNEFELLYSNNYVTQEQIKRKKWKPITEVPAMFFAKVGAAVMLNRKRLVNTPFLLDNNTMAYKFSCEWDANFGRTLFDTINLASLVQVGALPSYNANDVEGIEILLPTLEEQHQIGTFFSQLDTLLTLHQRKLEALQKLKKALLQKMFP